MTETQTQSTLVTAPSPLRGKLIAMSAALAFGVASAQETAPAGPLDLTASITSFGNSMRGVITTNAPALFVILALAVGFYFLWGRVRSLF